MITKMQNVFDLDNTLIFTDSLNNEAYNYALKQLNFNTIHNYKRITRAVVFDKFPNISSDNRNRIVELKQKYFIENLDKTAPNKSLLELLVKLDYNQSILWTNASEQRVFAILDYYKIRNSFSQILFSRKVHIANDVEKICRIQECRHQQLVFYEDNQSVIDILLKLNLKTIAIEPPDN